MVELFCALKKNGWAPFADVEAKTQGLLMSLLYVVQSQSFSSLLFSWPKGDTLKYGARRMEGVKIYESSDNTIWTIFCVHWP